VVAAALSFGCLAAIQTTAWSHDHRPPRNPALTVGTERQVGRPIHLTWTRRVGPNECDSADGFGGTTFPKAIPFAPGSGASITLRKASPPREWQLSAWTAVDRTGRPKGQPETVPAALLPPSEGGVPDRWQLHFATPVSGDHVYLQLDVYWADEESCGGSPDLGAQSGSWTYHLRPAG
jgi:hypothetical protein